MWLERIDLQALPDLARPFAPALLLLARWHMRFWTSARYSVPLPAGHRFPMEKYARLRDSLVASGVAAPGMLHEPAAAAREDILRVHEPEWVDRLTSGRLTAREVRLLGFPWSPTLVERAWRSVGGTCEAAEAALVDGVAMNLAGGTHHAFPTHGEGYCVFNDVAVALRRLLSLGRVGRAAVIDLDVHQGNGTNQIFAGDERVYTFSMHARRNYPFRKVAGSLDIPLEDGTGDQAYMELLGDALPRLIRQSGPDLVVYLAGADPHEGDRLGRLRLSSAGLARRDRAVLRACREVGIPVAITIAGGYGRDLETTVAVHAATARIARDYA